MSYGHSYPVQARFQQRYSRWDGTQHIADFTADDLMEAISDDVLADGNLERALQRLMRWGMDGRDGQQMPGIRDLIDRLKQMRQQELNRYDIGSVLEDIKERLEEIKQLERDGIQRRLDQASDQNAQAGEPADGEQAGESGSSESAADPEAALDDFEQQQALRDMLEKMAERKLEQLHGLPEDAAGQIRELQDYEFMDQDARQKFQELMEQLQQQVLNSAFEGMQQSLQNMNAQDMQSLQNMLKDLNQMLEDKANGVDPNFEQFMHKHGHYFGGQDINSLEELMDHMAQQMAAMQSMLDSMTPKQRMELWNAMQSVMNDPGVQDEMQRLSENLAQMMPDNPYAQQYQFRGGEELSLAEAMRLMDRLQDMEEIEDQLRGIRDWQDLENLDDEKLQQLLGDQFRQDIDQLKQLTRMLEDAGYIRRNRDGFEMTPRGIRKIGQKALNDIFQQLKQDRIGQHEMDRGGFGIERIDESKRYEFGDPFLLDLPQTLRNSVYREGPGSPLQLTPDDFEVYRTEMTTQTSTVLMVDMSRSMLYNGCFSAAKKVALALDSLIRGQYPRDSLYIVGFSYIATELKPTDLPTITWDEYNYGTNLQHGLMLARQFLGRHKGGSKQIIVITDGEPTAHFDEFGDVHFNYPPTWRTLQETLKEVVRCTREKITINTFMMDRSPYMTGFVQEIAKINKGRAFFAEPDRLGEYLLVDYVSNKRKVERA
ncbi:VWA domain-containing protein [soil metagenome]